MNIPAALISTALGTAFFAAGYTFYVGPPSYITNLALPAMLTPTPYHAKARAAVSRLLFNPASAEFNLLRTVEVDAAQYVCGNVNAKDVSGSYAGNHAFVYSVAVDFARIDDDGRISQKHAAYGPCPAPDARQGSKGGTSGPNGGKGGTSGTGTGPSDNRNENDRNETEWRGDRPPAAWPTFPPDHPLRRPAANRTPALAFALAKDVEDRWDESKSGNTKVRPSSEEIREACRALLAIDPKNGQFPKAWAAFVRLRKIDRDAS